jgi:hypothetical protein
MKLTINGALALLTACLLAAPAASMALDVEKYTDAGCGVSFDVPKGMLAKVKKEGCEFTLEDEASAVAMYAASKKGKVEFKELENYIQEETEVPADKWKKFDEGEAHVGYKATTDEGVIWAAAEKGAANTCIVAFAAEDEKHAADLEKLYKTMKCS